METLYHFRLLTPRGRFITLSVVAWGFQQFHDLETHFKNLEPEYSEHRVLAIYNVFARCFVE